MRVEGLVKGWRPNGRVKKYSFSSASSLTDCRKLYISHMRSIPLFLYSRVNATLTCINITEDC